MKKIINLSLFILALIGLAISAFAVYYYLFNDDITVGTNYVGVIETADLINSEDLTEEEVNEYEQRYFMEVNYFDNSNENGEALQEIKFNYSSDYLLTDSFATGMQYLGKFEAELRNPDSEHNINNYVSSAFNYYDSYDRIDWKSTTNLNRNNILIISIDGHPYSIKLDGKIDKKFDVLSLFSITYETIYFDYSDVFASVMDAVESNSAGYGDWYFKMDLSKYFTIQKLDPETGKFLEDDITDIIKNYIVVKIHYEENGAVSSTQSMFGIIYNDPNYDLDENPDTSYWQERVVYNLTEQNLNLRWSDTYAGYFASLSLADKALFESMPRTKVNILLDISNSQIIGFDYNAFEDFELDTITITSSSTKTFYFLDSSIINTNLNALEHSAEIIIDYDENAYNNEFSEVILWD